MYLRPEWTDPNRPLMDKYREAFAAMKERRYIPSKTNVFVDNATPAWFLATILGALYIGCTVCLPEIYRDENTLFYHRLFAYFVVAEIFINFYMTKTVTSFHEPNNGLIGGTLGTEAQFTLDYTEQVDNSDETKLLIGDELIKNETAEKERNAWTPILVQVASPNEVVQGVTRRIKFPYWSWKPCVLCKHHRPPRSHHCPVCGKCVLKRDHHCFFTNSCIGVNNQRYFIVLVFWATVATSYGLYHSLLYVPVQLKDDVYWDLVLPVMVVRWMVGYLVGGYKIFRLMCLYSLVWVFIQSALFLPVQLRLACKGKTGYEDLNSFKITNTCSLSENVRGVFGSYWMLNVLIPCYFFPCRDNGIRWPNIKM